MIPASPRPVLIKHFSALSQRQLTKLRRTVPSCDRVSWSTTAKRVRLRPLALNEGMSSEVPSAFPEK
eukprot:3128895-Rhodomonas_salina.1